MLQSPALCSALWLHKSGQPKAREDFFHFFLLHSIAFLIQAGSKHWCWWGVFRAGNKGSLQPAGALQHSKCQKLKHVRTTLRKKREKFSKLSGLTPGLLRDPILFYLVGEGCACRLLLEGIKGWYYFLWGNRLWKSPQNCYSHYSSEEWAA